MKTISKIIITCGLFITTFAFETLGQSSVLPNNQGGDNPENLDRATVPGSVTDSYVNEYPATSSEVWYSYPGYVSTAEWYEYKPYATVMNTNTEYYSVEFTSDKTPYRIVYSKDGKKVSTYRTIDSELPKAVINALKKSPYKSWTVTKEKEEMWKDSDKKKIYKVVVEKGNEKHALYYQEDGKLNKDKTIKS